jgi:pimeloyl-ACP methyl ester carboxylesterase
MDQLTEDLFNKLISEPKSEHSLEVLDGNIFYQKWGTPDNPGIVLVHGSGAHSHWWDFVAPLLIDQYEVCALDLSGMGSSDHREHYSPEIFGEEIIAVAEDSGFFDNRPSNPIICGHSLGGYMSIHATNLASEDIKGVIMIDSPIRPPHFDYSNHQGSGPIRKRKTYPDKKTILERFKLAPDQPTDFPFVIDYIAKNSIQEVNGGFEWKFDDTLFSKLGYPHMPKNNAFNLLCPLGFIYGENSALVTEPILNYMKSKFKEDTPIIEIKGAHHHVLLDKPIELAETIKKIVEGW